MCVFLNSVIYLNFSGPDYRHVVRCAIVHFRMQTLIIAV